MYLFVVLAVICSVIAGNIATPPDTNYPKCWAANIRPPDDSRSNEEGADVSITCESKRGMPEPNLEWTRDGVEVDNQEHFSNTNMQTTNNRIAWVLSGIDHDATYTCTQTHPEASDSTCSFGPLRVKYGPDVIVDPETLTREVGQVATFQCSATGNPAVTEIVWRFNDTIPPDPQRFVVSSDNQLVVHDITYEDYALEIKCEARSSRSTGSKYVTIMPVTTTVATTAAISTTGNITSVSASPNPAMLSHVTMYSIIITTMCMWVYK